MTTQETQNAQKAHYEAIHDAYEAHYYDGPSMAYRHRFIYRPLLEGINLENASVADLACGSGHNSLALRSYFPSITTTGYDISEAACRDYRIHTGGDAHLIDLTLPTQAAQVHDAALIIGGLHHCVADLKTTLKNVAGMVRPGGHFLMMEPNDDFFLSAVRRIWYKKDRWFEADTEEALKHSELAALGAPYFVPEKVMYVGGPAFYLILNSLITRVPLGAKPALSSVLFPVESAYNRLPGKGAFAVFLARWRRTDVPA
ncbi:MAG: class I SAM-dependent methyltransferase [Alphaproteobacteria bacterium]|nr:class I SAM-dependent methyltransferase [Alphaproteobacteria bacterium]